MVAKKNASLAPATLMLKIESLGTRAKLLTQLRHTLNLKAHQDIRPEQWEALEGQLAAVSNRIRQQLRSYTDRYLSEHRDVRSRAALLNHLGELEVKITQAYTFYDTFMDILSQRLSDHIGPLLRGCDAIAADGLKKGFLADITVPPLVYCDRGFGASTLREGVSLAQQPPNPIPFIGIPYSRMDEKYNLISIYHEVGHQALVKLNLVPTMQRVFADAMAKAGAAPLMQSLFANWSKELAPDFWAFAHTGMAQTASIRDVLILPRDMMFQISPYHPHPPAYLRFLASVSWCRHLWGRGDWDEWEAEWTDIFSLRNMDKLTGETILAARRLLPVAAKAIIGAKFRKLGGKPLLSLFDMKPLEPDKLKALATRGAVASPEFHQQPTGVQLAALRLLRESRTMSLKELNSLMSRWLVGLSNKQQ